MFCPSCGEYVGSEGNRREALQRLADMMIQHPGVHPILKGILEHNPDFLTPLPSDPFGVRFKDEHGFDMRGPFAPRKRKRDEFTQEEKIRIMDAWGLFG